MSDIPRSSTESIIAATRIIANWHMKAAFKAATDGDATDHMIHASALTEAADRLVELDAKTGQMSDNTK